ncbi:MAG: LptF/LptG family permease [Phycisphaerales bacterium]|nr:LptF/LptG family permease [Phycisphaerales bacterium]
MRRRQPLHLWLYILFELWRLILLTLGVLVLVLAFAVAIKPLADGKIGPVEALRFMALAVVPMLEYALPFAAGFGATLAYHRLSADNEVIAAHASGVSHRSILAPALFSGILLSGVMVLLSQQVIPTFLRSMEQLITQDIAKILVNSIERGQSVTLGDNRLYADHVVRVEPLPDSGASDEFILTNVAVVVVDSKNIVKRDFTAAKAHVWVMLPGMATPGATGDPSSSTIIFSIEDAVINEPGRLFGELQQHSFARDAGRAFRDDPKFLTYDELEHLKVEPDRMNWIEAIRAELASRLITKLIADRMQQQLTTQHQISLKDAQGRTMTVRASQMRWNPTPGRWELDPIREGGAIDIEIAREQSANGPAGPVTRLSAREVELSPGYRAARPDQRLVFELRAKNAAVRGLDSGNTSHRNEPATTVPERIYTDITYPTADFAGLADKTKTPLSSLVSRVDQELREHGNDPWLQQKRDELLRRIAKLQREVLSKQQQRFAMAIACLVMVITGAVTATQLSSSLPLTVYLWSFFPALAALITISTGQQVTHDKGLWGLIILWGGVGMLGVYGALGYVRMARH